MKMRKIVIFAVAICLVISLASCGGGNNKSAAVINSPADFEGNNIAVQSETTADDAIRELIDGGMKIEVSRYEKVTQCFDDLVLGRVDAVFVDSVVAAYYTGGSDKYKRAWIDSEEEPMGICLKQGSDKLAAAIEAALDTMFFDGSMAAIENKHFGDYYTGGLRNPSAAPPIPKDFSTINEGKLLVGMEVGYPPMEYTTDDGLEFIGFDIDVANKLGELLGLKVEFINTAWDGIFFGLEKGEYDVIMSSVSITPERQAKYILTEPYVANALCIVVKAD